MEKGEAIKGDEKTKAFAKYLETIHPTNLWLQERAFQKIYDHWNKHIYKTVKSKL